MGLPMEKKFNPDPGKQAQEVIFGRKTKKEYHSPHTTIMYQKLSRSCSR